MLFADYSMLNAFYAGEYICNSGIVSLQILLLLPYILAYSYYD